MNIPFGDCNGNSAQARAIKSSMRAFFRARGVDVGSLVKTIDTWIENPRLLDAKPSEQPEKKPIAKSEPHQVDDAQFWMSDEYKVQEKERERRIMQAGFKPIEKEDKDV